MKNPQARADWGQWIAANIPGTEGQRRRALDWAFKALQRGGESEEAVSAAWASLEPDVQHDKWSAWVTQTLGGTPDQVWFATNAALEAVVRGGNAEQAATAARTYASTPHATPSPSRSTKMVPPEPQPSPPSNGLLRSKGLVNLGALSFATAGLIALALIYLPSTAFHHDYRLPVVCLAALLFLGSVCIFRSFRRSLGGFFFAAAVAYALVIGLTIGLHGAQHLGILLVLFVLGLLSMKAEKK